MVFSSELVCSRVERLRTAAGLFLLCKQRKSLQGLWEGQIIEGVKDRWKKNHLEHVYLFGKASYTREGDDGEAMGFIRNVLLALALIITPLMSDLSPAAGKSQLIPL